MIKGRLFQEDLYREPFWMLVCCQLVNMTKWKQAEPVYDDLRLHFPDPHSLSIAHPSEVKQYIEKLGFGNRRSESLVNFAKDWLEYGRPSDWMQVLRMHGCGRYAADTWRIFMQHHTIDDFSRDGKLLTMDKELRTWLQDGGYVDQNGVHSGRSVVL